VCMVMSHTGFENCLGKAWWRASIEWAVVWLNNAHNLARPLTGENGPENERKMGRAESVTASVAMRLQPLGDRR
jgi:hypothetical protein